MSSRFDIIKGAGREMKSSGTSSYGDKTCGVETTGNRGNPVGNPETTMSPAGVRHQLCRFCASLVGVHWTHADAVQASTTCDMCNVMRSVNRYEGPVPVPPPAPPSRHMPLWGRIVCGTLFALIGILGILAGIYAIAVH